MPSQPPKSTEEILATAKVHPEFVEIMKANSSEPGPSFTLDEFKKMAGAGLAQLQRALATSRPTGIIESEHYISLRDGYKSRIILCYKSERAAGSPLIILYHGGGHTVGYPEMELSLARELALTHSAVVICPSYRLAPEHPFPFSINDSWDTLQWAAAENSKSESIFPPFTDPQTGFIIGGTSAGGNLTATLAHLARDNSLSPPLTGQFNAAGTVMSPQHVPAKYKPFYLSREQNAHAPILNEELSTLMRNAFKPDQTSPLWASFDQHDPEDAPGEVKMGHMNLPPTYLQVCGMDMSRDDGLIYEKVLREECGVKTRLDLYEGLPHCWWTMYPQLEVSKKRMTDSVQGIGWLLHQP